MRISGKWDSNKPTAFRHYDSHVEPMGCKDMGGKLFVDAGAVSMEVVGTPRRFYMHITPPGWHSMHYVIKDGVIHFDESAWGLRRRIPGCVPTQAADGIVYLYTKRHGLRNYRGDEIPLPSIQPHTADQFWQLFLECADEIYTLARKPKVVTTISGGTDGIMTALALREIGANQVCVCVGRDSRDFDPMWAKRYAADLELPYTFLPIPTIDRELNLLLYETIEAIEMKDFSNVLMGMCNVLVCREAVSCGAEMVFTADFADVILGNDMLTYGTFNKDHIPPNDASAWARYRRAMQLHTLPNNMEVARVFRAGGLDHRQIFYHPKIIQFLLSCDFTLTPPSSDKVIYKSILDGFLRDASWRHPGRAKIGYYTGSGMGKIRLENPVLQDPHIREVYAKKVPA